MDSIWSLVLLGTSWVLPIPPTVPPHQPQCEIVREAIINKFEPMRQAYLYRNLVCRKDA